jgi:hypothetical protein
MTTYGSGIGGVDDLDPAFAILDDRTSTALDLVRRLSTPRGSLPWAPDDGLDLRAYLNADLDSAELNALRTEIVHELEKDERVASATVDLNLDSASSTLRLSIACDGAAGPFSFVVAASALGVTFLGVS